MREREGGREGGRGEERGREGEGGRERERERERGMNTTQHLLPCIPTSIARLLPQNELSFLKSSLSSFALGLSVSSFCIAQYILTPTKSNFRACSE